MSANPSIWKRKRQELDHQRVLLQQQLQAAPDNAGISSQLKVIEAAIAECTRNLERGHPPVAAIEKREHR